MSLPIALVDAFTQTAGHGNRAGVVLDASALEPDAMRQAARAVAASETAFVTDRAALYLRYFTPTTEIPFCGHATVATLHLMREKGLLPDGPIRFGCPAGPL